MSTDTKRPSAREWEALLLSRASEIARTGDRWFVSLATDVADAGRWVRREADVIGDSMSAAFKTTVDVARKVSPGPDASGARDEEVRLEEARPGNEASLSDSQDGYELDADPQDTSVRTANIDLLTALGRVGVPEQVAESDLASHRAGIAPLLSALNEVVSSRKGGGYESLQSDERFWALLNLIHEHGESFARDVGSEPSTEERASAEDAGSR